MEKKPFVPESFATELAPFPPTSFGISIRTEDYHYELPADRIAAYPLADRADSKLLVATLVQNAHGQATPTIDHKTFRDIVDIIPTDALLVANDSRVIAARIPMNKLSGGAAEVFCLQPVFPSIDPAVTMLTEGSSRWLCMVGGRNVNRETRLERRQTLPLRAAEENNSDNNSDQDRIELQIELHAEIISKNGMESLVEFSWKPATMTFAAMLDQIGEIPLPPYIKRTAEASDRDRYQTVYAEHEGSVAAPTAGLHFTDEILHALADKGVRHERVTLHVGAGTFKPLSGETAADHVMHHERIALGKNTIQALAKQVAMRSLADTNMDDNNLGDDNAGDNMPIMVERPIVAIGTTSMRTLESLYWWGVRLMLNDASAQTQAECRVAQWDVYRLRAALAQEGEPLPSASTALNAVLMWMDDHQTETLAGETQMIIVPGYEFALCDALVTNFHQPQSTLMLLVAAFVGDWRVVYDAALAAGYRFLSYGDSSLLIKARSR
jgi:S-adenosylmethionine:tRNA ribosyltransferase-isomerase